MRASSTYRQQLQCEKMGSLASMNWHISSIAGRAPWILLCLEKDHKVRTVVDKEIVPHSLTSEIFAAQHMYAAAAARGPKPSAVLSR